MTSRERWILYPLLFLTLGIALRDKVLPRTVPLAADTIICNHLEAGDAKCSQLQLTKHGGRDAIRLETVSGDGKIRIFTRNGESVVLGGDWLRKKPSAKAPPVHAQPTAEKWIDRLGRHWSMLEEWIEAKLTPEPPASQADDDAATDPDA